MGQSSLSIPRIGMLQCLGQVPLGRPTLMQTYVDLRMEQPTLEDVFLTITGHKDRN